MYYGFDLVLFQSAAQSCAIHQVGCDKFGPCVNGFSMTFVKAVIDHSLMAVVKQLFSDDTADVTCSPGDQHIHLVDKSFLDQPFVYDNCLVAL